MTTETVNIFEQASRLKLRFDTQVGNLCVEQLWDLPLSSVSKVSLDTLAIALNKEAKGTEESFVSNTKKNTLAKLKFDVVKYIIDLKIQENAAKTEAVQKRAKLEKINELIASKQDESLSNLSIEELEALKAGL